MGFDKPSDLFLMVGVASLAMFIISMGLLSIQTEHDATLTPGIEGSLYILNQSIQSNLSTTPGSVNDALASGTTAGDQETEEGLIVRSWNSIKNLGAAYSVADKNTQQFGRAIGIDNTIYTITIGMLLVVFSVVVYGYIRGIR